MSPKKSQTVIQLFTEAKILEALKHPNIINLKEFYKTQSNKLVLILEYAAGGDLGCRIQDLQGKRLNDTLIRSKLKRVDYTTLPGNQIFA